MEDSRLSPIQEDRFGIHEAAHLLRRTLIGAKATEVFAARDSGLRSTIDTLFQPYTPDYFPIAHFVGTLVNSEVSPNDSPRSIAYFQEQRGRYTDFRQWWCKVILDSPTSIQERLVLLWHMHFATSCNGAHYAEHSFDQNEVMRKNAFGNLKTLANDVTLGFAMQAYLDGFSSFWTDYRNCINENHARELLELHLLGHAGRGNVQAYKQADIVALSKAMCGNHIVENWSPNADDGTRSLWRERTILWRRDRWYPFENEIFGSRGTFTPYDVIPLIFKNCADDVAWWFARRLCTEFCAVSAELEPTDIDKVAALLLEREWNLQSVLETLLSSEMFFDPRYRMRLVRPPIHLLLGMLRTFSATEIADYVSDTPRDSIDLLQRLAQLGQLPYNPPNVSGWHRDVDWLTATDSVARIDTCRRFGSGSMTYFDKPGMVQVLRYDPLSIAREFGNPLELETLCSNVAITLLGTDAHSVTDSLVMNALGKMPRSDWNPNEEHPESVAGLRRMFTNALSAPRYQLY